MKEPKVYTVTLAGNLPRDALRVVLVQPNVTAELGPQGFSLTDQSRVAQLIAFREVYRQMRDGGAHFLVLPEYALPYVALEALDEEIKSTLPRDGIVLAGLDSMPFADFARLISHDPWAPCAEEQKRSARQWVNALAVWAHTGDGTVKRFLQPKLVPAGEEQKIGGMYLGEYILRFEAGEFSFSLLNCRDLIGHVQFPGDHRRRQQPLAEWLTDRLSEQRLTLDVLFWLQYNNQPEDRGFVRALESLLCDHAVRCVVAANHAGFGKSAFYFPKGLYREEPRTEEQPRSYAFQRLPDSFLYRALFRTDDPAAFLFTYRPRHGNALEQGLIPLDSEQEWQISGDGRLRGGVPVDPLLFGCEVAQKESDPSKLPGPSPSIPRYNSQEVLRRQIAFFLEIYQTLRSIREGDRREIIRTLFACQDRGWGEPVEWSAQEKRHIGDLMLALSALRFVGRVSLPGGEAATTARLADPVRLDDSFRYVTVVRGDPQFRLEICGELSAGELSALYGKGLPAMTAMLVLNHHPASSERVRIREAVHRRLEAHADALSQVDRAPVPAGEQPVTELTRIDRSHVPWVTAHSYRKIEDFLFRAPDVARAAVLIKKEVMP